MKLKFFIVTIAAFVFACLPAGGSFAAETSGLCDGCPLQEICSNTTEGVEVLSCSDNAAAKTPAMDTATAMIAEEAGHAGDTAAVSAQKTLEADLSDSKTTAETVLDKTAASAEVSVFSSLTAYSSTNETGIIVTLKGEKNVIDQLSSIITSQLAPEENKSPGCEILLATSSEITLKIKKEAEKEKIDFLKAHGIKIDRQ
ncbi:MAG TPA: hypothetical protein PK467_15865 [Candidatus Wallbacteria bacterium]|nr:hypothetical protein [Candidatus Wallbacteria bacterium]